MQKNYKTNRLSIQQVQLADADELMTLFEDRQLSLLSGLTLPETPIQRTMAFQMMSTRPYLYVLRLTTNQRLVGVIGFYPCYCVDMTSAPQDRELGYALEKHYWNQGLMTEACQVLVQAYLAEDPLRTLHANVMPRNMRSRRVLAKNGFQPAPTPMYLASDEADDEKIHLQCGCRK